MIVSLLILIITGCDQVNLDNSNNTDKRTPAEIVNPVEDKPQTPPSNNDRNNNQQDKP